MRSIAPYLALAACTTAGTVGAAPPCAAQAPARGVVRAIGIDAGVLAPGGARRTAAFGGTLDLGVGHRGLLRIGLSSWVADVRRDSALYGRDLALLWLLRSPPLGAGWRVFAAAGPAVSPSRPGGADGAPPPRAALATEAGVELARAPPDALALELRLGGLAPVGGRAQLSLRLGLRVRPGAIRRLTAGEPMPPPPVAEAQPAPPPPDLEEVLADAAGVLALARVGGALRLEEAAFDSPGTQRTRDAYRRLGGAGRTLRRLGADRLRVVIYTSGPTGVGPDAASRRAVAVARALAHGGYPADRIALEVAPPAEGDAGAGRILAGTRCISGCVVPASRPPR